MTRFLIAAAFLATAASAQTSEKILFRVHVVNQLDGAPIQGANVTLYSTGDQKGYGRTDPGGSCELSLTAGRYLLSVSRKGYFLAAQRGTMGKIVEIRSGAPNEITVQLTQSGVIAGRVVDQYGDPVHRAIVRSIDKLRPTNGSDDGYEGFTAAFTDDRGEFRIANVVPGLHYVGVEFDSENIDQFSGTVSRFRWPRTGGYVFYPDATRIDEAQQIEVSSGQVTRVQDLHLSVRGAVSVSGRIVPAPQGKGASVQLEPAVGRFGLNVTAGRGGLSKPDGSFKITVLPGSYVLHASNQQTGKISQSVRIDLNDEDLPDIELKLQLSYELSGRIVVDGQEKLDFSKLRLSLLGPNEKIDSTGAFHANLLGNQGLYMLQGLPDGWYVKDVMAGGKHISGKTFEAQPGITDFSITVSPRAAHFEVGLESGANDVVYVFLLPAGAQVLDVDSLPISQRDADGRFAFASVPPGSYRVFSFDAAHWGLMFDPQALLEKYGSEAPLITLAESDRKSILVRATKFERE